jgi:hypothetical protein
MELQQQLVLPPPSPSTAVAVTPPKPGTTTTTTTVSVAGTSSEAVMFHLTATLSHVSLSLLREGDKFFETRLEGIGAELDMKEDSSLFISADLKRFMVKDLYGTAWPEIFSTGTKEESAIDFKYWTFNPKASSYPGHDMKVWVRLASIKVVFVNR